MRKTCNERPRVGCVSNRSRNGVPFGKGCKVNGQMTKASNKPGPRDKEKQSKKATNISWTVFFRFLPSLKNLKVNAALNKGP